MIDVYRFLFITLAVMGPWTSEARRAITWPPKRARESVLWPSPPFYSIDEVGDDDDEPSCEELRAIWRLSKRAAQKSLLTNEVPLHPPPPPTSRRGQFYGYMVRSPQLTKDGRPRQSFGRIVVDPSRSHPSSPKYGTGFDQVAKEMKAGTFAEKPFVRVGVSGSPSYGRIAYPTPPPQLAYGKTRASYKPFTKPFPIAKPGTVPPSRKPDKNANQWGSYKDPYLGKIPLRKPPVYGRYDSPRSGFNADMSGCHDVAYKRCQVDEDCACYGLYQCIKGKCKTSTSNTSKALSKWESPGIWHERPLLPSELGASPPSTSSQGIKQETLRHNKHRLHDRKKVLPNYGFSDQFGTWS